MVMDWNNETRGIIMPNSILDLESDVKC